MFPKGANIDILPHKQMLCTPNCVCVLGKINISIFITFLLIRRIPKKEIITHPTKKKNLHGKFCTLRYC